MRYTFNGQSLITHTINDHVLAVEPMSLPEYRAFCQGLADAFGSVAIRVTVAPGPVAVVTSASGTVRL